MSSDMTRPFSFSLMASMLSISLVSSLASNNGADTKGGRKGEGEDGIVMVCTVILHTIMKVLKSAISNLSPSLPPIPPYTNQPSPYMYMYTL